MENLVNPWQSFAVIVLLAIGSGAAALVLTEMTEKVAEWTGKQR